jgi:hypothetical protein
MSKSTPVTAAALLALVAGHANAVVAPTAIHNSQTTIAALSDAKINASSTEELVALLQSLHSEDLTGVIRIVAKSAKLAACCWFCKSKNHGSVGKSAGPTGHLESGRV